MAAFLKVGEELINVALVSKVSFSHDGKSVTVSVTGMQGHTFWGEAVVNAIREWLAQNTDDLGVTPDPDPSGADLVSI
jgi:hypothetical protein